MPRVQFTIAAILLGWCGFVFGVETGVSPDEARGISAKKQQMARDIVERTRAEQEKIRRQYYKKMDKQIEQHVFDQKTHDELKGSRDRSLYTKVLEFHDRDGDGLPDHSTEGSMGSTLEKAFDPGQNKKLRVYKYLESYKGFALKNPKRTEYVRHLRREFVKDKQEKIEEIAKDYSRQVMDQIRSDKGHLNIDLAEDAVRDFQEKMDHDAQEMFEFQRVKRLEKIMELRSKRHKARVKGAYRVDAVSGTPQSEWAIKETDRLDSKRKGSRPAEFEATSTMTLKERAANIKSFYSTLKEYKRTHPHCLKPEWTCYVDSHGKIVEQRITDSYKAAEQVLDAQEYEAQAEILRQKRGKAFWERLPGEVENFSPEVQRMIAKEREKERRRQALVKRIIEKRKKTVIKDGRIVTEEVDTGKTATQEEILKKSKPSAFEDFRQGDIDLEQLKKERGRGDLFKSMDY